jgi:small-conductance mechanosensitive channel
MVEVAEFPARSSLREEVLASFRRSGAPAAMERREGPERSAAIHSDSYSEFLAVQEELVLRILEIVEAAGTSDAFPSQTAYLLSDSPPDTDAGSKA